MLSNFSFSSFRSKLLSSSKSGSQTHFCALQVEANVRRVKAEVTAKCEALKSCITAYEVATHARLDTAVLFARARAEAFEHVTQRGEAVIADLTLVR